MHPRRTLPALATAAAVLAAVSSCAAPRPAAPAADGPTNLTWTAVSGIEVPAADQGPTVRTWPAPTGYQHSRTGAALAAINAAVRVGVAGDGGEQSGEPEWALVTRDLVAPGRAKDFWIAQRARIRVGPVDPAKAPRIVAYRVSDYRDDGAAVEVYAIQADRSATVNHVEVAWTAADDWGLVMPAPEEQTDPAQYGSPRIESVTTIPHDAVQLR